MNPVKISAKVFDPENPAYRWKLWIKRDSRHGFFYHIYWRRIGALLGVVLLIGWLLGTAGLWFTERYVQGFSEPRYVDLALPWRWSRYRSAMGSDYLKLGRLALQSGSTNTALSYLSESLHVDPGNRESLRLAALTRYRLGSKAGVLALLRTKVASAAKDGDQAYLQTFFEIAFDLQADDEAFAVGRDLLPQAPDSAGFHRFIALQMATARFNRGHYSEAEQILADWKLQDEPEGEIVFAECEAEQGRYANAVGRLEGDLARLKRQDGIYATLVRLAQDQGDAEMELRYALLRRDAEPSNPKARIDLLYADHALGTGADIRREIEAYCADFKSDPDAISLLAQFAIEAGEPHAAERARDLAKAKGMGTVEFDIAIAQAAIAAGDYPRAVKVVTLAQGDGGSLGQAYDATLAGTKVVALFGARDSRANLAFSNFLPLSEVLPHRAGHFLAHHLHILGLAAQSQQLLERVCDKDPDDEQALAELVSSDAATGNRDRLMVDLPRLLKMRKPPRDALDASLMCLDPSADGALCQQVTLALSASPTRGSRAGL